jgi:homoserine O-acetyltransferase
VVFWAWVQSFKASWAWLTWHLVVISDNLWLTGTGKTLDPANYYIIIPALFGNGQSASPSNKPDLRPFPEITFYDNVRAQHELVTKHLGIRHARAVLGWSMGAGQTFQWATQYPDFMDLIAPFCGAAKTSLHNQAMLEGVKSALYAAKGTSSEGVGEQHLSSDKAQYVRFTEETKQIGLKALGRVYSGWGFSQAFYRARLHETVLGFKDIEDFMVNFWESWACSKDPENMLVMANTWQIADCELATAHGGVQRQD